jgi:hypothetical protein
MAMMRPEDVQPVVVESDEGEILASLAVLRVAHLEGMWVNPSHRNGGVVRALIRGVVPIARQWSNGWAFGGAADDKMRAILKGLGGVKIPMDLYALTVSQGE